MNNTKLAILKRGFSKRKKLTLSSINGIYHKSVCFCENPRAAANKVVIPSQKIHAFNHSAATPKDQNDQVENTPKNDKMTTITNCILLR